MISLDYSSGYPNKDAEAMGATMPLSLLSFSAARLAETQWPY